MSKINKYNKTARQIAGAVKSFRDKKINDNLSENHLLLDNSKPASLKIEDLPINSLDNSLSASDGLESIKPASGGLECLKPASDGLESIKPASGGLECLKPASDGLECIG